mgnify:CR=1 FL=1
MDEHAKQLIKHYIDQYDEPQYEIVKALLEPEFQPRLKRKNWKQKIVKLLEEDRVELNISGIKQELLLEE